MFVGSSRSSTAATKTRSTSSSVFHRAPPFSGWKVNHLSRVVRNDARCLSPALVVTSHTFERPRPGTRSNVYPLSVAARLIALTSVAQLSLSDISAKLFGMFLILLYGCHTVWRLPGNHISITQILNSTENFRDTTS